MVPRIEKKPRLHVTFCVVHLIFILGVALRHNMFSMYVLIVQYSITFGVVSRFNGVKPRIRKTNESIEWLFGYV